MGRAMTMAERDDWREALRHFGSLALQLGEAGGERGDLGALRRSGSWRAQALLK
jgi:hypothetical protein